MRTIIAGSRNFCKQQQVLKLIEQTIKEKNIEITTVLSGAARGVDRYGEMWAKQNGIPIEQYFARWTEEGTKAGYLRNREMGKKAEQLLAIFDGSSKGTKHMIDIANELKLQVHVVTAIPEKCEKFCCKDKK